jgi:photosystem II stability/assembly factor-like uncharacterized protein
VTDRFEELVMSTRSALLQRADEIADSERMLADIVDGGPRVTVDGGGRRGNGWRFVAVAAAVVALLVGGLMTLRQLRDDAERPATTDTPSTTTPLPRTSTPPPPTTAAGWSPVLTDVRDLTFVDAQHGWALVGTGDASSDLLSTTDGGRTWVSTGAETSNADHVVFADAANGWMYSQPLVTGPLLSTHDGGLTWNPVDLTRTGLIGEGFTVTSDGTTVAIVSGDSANESIGFAVATSPVDHDDFSRAGLGLRAGAGPVVDFSVAADGGNVWAVLNDRVVTDIGRVVDGSVRDWTVPWSDLGGPATLSVSRGGVLYANVWAGVWTGSTIEYEVYVSRDSGTSFSRVGLPLADHAVDSPVAVTAVDGDTVLVTTSDANGAPALYRSTDAGATWTAVPSFPADAMPPSRSADGSTLFALRPGTNGSAASLTISTDGGATWSSPS